MPYERHRLLWSYDSFGRHHNARHRGSRGPHRSGHLAETTKQQQAHSTSSPRSPFLRVSRSIDALYSRREHPSLEENPGRLGRVYSRVGVAPLDRASSISVAEKAVGS